MYVIFSKQDCKRVSDRHINRKKLQFLASYSMLKQTFIITSLNLIKCDAMNTSIVLHHFYSSLNWFKYDAITCFFKLNLFTKRTIASYLNKFNPD